MQESAPEHSKTISNPSGTSKCFKAISILILARRNCSSFVFALSTLGGQYVSFAKPLAFTKSKRSWLMSIATMSEAPRDLASAQARIPIAPTPRTRMVWPGETFARRDAWMSTESGSASAACSKEQLSGRLKSDAMCQ
jgi:hypothetical protein